METYAIVVNGVVVNLVEYATAPGVNAMVAFPAGATAVLATNGCSIGWTYANGTFTNPNPPPAAPIPNILRRQFYQQLSVQGIITQAQALAAVQGGTIPAPLQTVVNGLPSAEQFGATMMLAADATFSRNHPMTIAIGTAYGWTSAQIDSFFQAASQL
jgi:hypothetical protein